MEEKRFEWKPYDKNIPGREQGLRDHYFYLVTHKEYKTPMKAKWHDEGCWQVFGETKPNPRPDCTITGYYYDWEEEHPIVAWMDLPDIYQIEKKRRPI